MEIGLLGSGLFMGFSLAVGVGPVNVLCIRRSIAEGFGSGLWSGFGAATADAVFAVVVGFGLASVAGLIESHSALLQIGGSLFLIGWGIRVAFATVEAGEDTGSTGRIVVNFVTTFLLTLLNPANLATFALAGTGLGLLDRELGPRAVLLIVSGVFVGSMGWWTLLATGAVSLKKRFVGDLLPVVNKVAGIIIVAFGVALLIYDPSPDTEARKRSTAHTTTNTAPETPKK